MLETHNGTATEKVNSNDSAKTLKEIYLYILATIIVVGFFALIAALMIYPLPEDSSGVIMMLFGTLSAGFGLVLGYFFGSSKSSVDKTDIIASQKPK